MKTALFVVLMSFVVTSFAQADEKPNKDAIKTAMEMMAKQTTIECSPVEITVFVGTRFHVKCSKPVGKIAYFAMQTKDNSAALAMNLILNAYEHNSVINIDYTLGDTSGDAYGCAKDDCRAIQNIWLAH